MKEDNPGYYAIIPATVRYDETIPPNAKLLYGELTALSNKEGHCWASNGYFANLYKVHKNTVSGWIRVLLDSKYIWITNKKRPDGSMERLIGINEKVDPPQRKQGPPSTKKLTPFNEKIDHNIKDNTTSSNTSSNTEEPPPPNQRAYSDHFVAKYLAVTGYKYSFETKDGVGLARWIKAGNTLVGWIDLVDKAFAMYQCSVFPFETSAPTISKVLSQANTIRTWRPKSQKNTQQAEIHDFIEEYAKLKGIK